MLAEESAAAMHDEVVSTDEQHVNVGEPEQLQEVQYHLHPADAFTDDGELRVYTQPLEMAPLRPGGDGPWCAMQCTTWWQYA